jgi:hypothetical protein
MEPNTIAILPPYGYKGDKQSGIAIKWLEWLMHKDPTLNIQHAGNGFEKCFDNYKVDGWDPVLTITKWMGGILFRM